MTAVLQLSDSARPATFTVDAIDEHGTLRPTAIAGEHALTIYLDKREIVTLMTLGAAPEHLVLGYLLNQRLIASVADLAAVQVDWTSSAAAVTSTVLATTGRSCWEAGHGTSVSLQARLAKRTVTSGCGQGTVFGDLMADIDAAKIASDAQLDQATLYAVLENVRRYESIYKQAGAVHGCALCANEGVAPGQILCFVEDVGRHNAVDAIAGWMLTEGISGDDKLFYTTGRLTSEMVIKCAQMRIPILLSRSGLTQMGFDLAQRLGMTMIGRCQGRHYLLFTGADRFISPAATTVPFAAP
jgi:FdhD protein